MELRLKHIHDEDKHYPVRVCIRVDEAVEVYPGSIIRACEECDVEVWYDPTQEIPEVPDLVLEPEVVLCIKCTALHAMADTEPMKWIGPGTI